MADSMDKQVADAINSVPEADIQAVGAPKIKYPDTFTTTNGVTLKLRAVPSHLSAAAQRAVVRPEVPTWYNPDRQRDEPNPLDPGYQDSLDDYQQRLGLVSSYCHLSMGTDVTGKLPEGIVPTDSTEWSDRLRDELQVGVPEKGRARYVEWLRMYVLSDPDFLDLIEAITNVGKYMPTEDAVATAAESFRGAEGRAADTNGKTPSK